MAIKAGVSEGTILNFEAGRLRPSMKTRRKLAAAYGLTVEQVRIICGIHPDVNGTVSVKPGIPLPKTAPAA
jgi:transcriptional regulator with XRE-family HTH domain